MRSESRSAAGSSTHGSCARVKCCVLLECACGVDGHASNSRLVSTDLVARRANPVPKPAPGSRSARRGDSWPATGINPGHAQIKGSASSAGPFFFSGRRIATNYPTSLATRINRRSPWMPNSRMKRLRAPSVGVESDTRDRVIALERDVRHLSDKIEHMDGKVTEMHELLVASRGARWMLLGMAMLGGFIASKVTMIASWFTTAK